MSAYRTVPGSIEIREPVLVVDDSVPKWSPDRRTFPVIDNSVRKIVHQPQTACPM